AEHGVGVLPDLVQAAAELDAAGLAAAAGMDLGLDHPEVTADRLGRVNRLLGRARHLPWRDRDAEVGEQLLGLVLVEIHSSPGDWEGNGRLGAGGPRLRRGTAMAARERAGQAGRPLSPKPRPRAKRAPAARAPTPALPRTAGEGALRSCCCFPRSRGKCPK